MYVDVLIVYELRAREIENASLLAAELQRRGYSAKICCLYSFRRYFSRSKVVIVPHLYDDFQVTALAKNFWLKTGEIIDLQYEQVLSTKGDTVLHSPKGQGVNAYHIAWGKIQFDRYVRYGITQDLIFTTGHVAMDLFRKEFDSYFFSKNDLAAQFHLDPSKKWILFTSSFSYANRTPQEISSFEKLFKDARAFSELSDNTYQKIIEWFYSLASKKRDYVFIYRPHPAEKLSPKTLELFKGLSNLHVIGKYSCRQWVKVCDIQYTWMSSSIIDSYYAKKPCLILRPIPLPETFDSALMIKAHKIETFEEFELSIEQNNDCFPVLADSIEDYYGKKDQKPAYIQIADLCESIIKSSKPRFRYVFSKSRFNIFDSSSVSSACRTWLIFLLFDICRHVDLNPLNRILRINSVKKMMTEGYQVDKEIKSNIRRFSAALDSSDETNHNQ